MSGSSSQPSSPGYQLGQKPSVCLGIDLARPVDRCVPGKWPFIENVVAVIDGTASPRPGLGAAPVFTALSAKTPLHTIATLSDPTAGAGTWTRFMGIQDRVMTQRSSGPTADTLGGFSGNPLSMVQSRPTESPEPWMYVADSLVMRKFSQSLSSHQIGLPPMVSPPTAILGSGQFKTIDLLRAVGTWAVGGSGTPAVALLAGANVPVNTTSIVGAWSKDAFNDGTNIINLQCIRPTSMAGIVVGEIINIVMAIGNEDSRVLETHAGTAAISISSILYVGSGYASVVLATPAREIEVNSLVQFVQGGTNEYARVIDTLEGPDGTTCITVKLVNTYTTPGSTVQAFPSFTVVTETASTPNGGAITNDGLRFSTIGATTAATPATLSKTVALDLSSLGSGSHATALDDYMSIVFRVDRPDLLSQILVMLDCGDAAFTGNYFVKAIRSSDLTSMLKFAQTALANRQDQIQRRQVDHPHGIQPDEVLYPNSPEDFGRPTSSDVTDPDSEITGPSGDQLVPGDNQFFAVQFRLREMQRVGGDDSKSWKDIAALRFAVQATGAINLDVTSWVLAGGFAPEVSDIDEGFTYRVRGRVSSTGVTSNYTPASVGPVRARRGAIALTFNQHPSTECDKLDIERHGGGVPGWHLIKTIENSVAPLYYDVIGNDAAAAEFEDDPSGLVSFQPWPTVQKPQTGTGTKACGTLLQDTTAPWSTSLAPGIPVIANGIQATLRRVLPQGGDAAGKASIIEVIENLGAVATPKWELPRPVYLGQPLPIYKVWQDAAGQMRAIGLGDPANPSAFYLSLAGNPDATNETLHYEIEGQVLQNVLIYNDMPFILTTEGLYRVDPAGFDDAGLLQLRTVAIPGARGCLFRWACCAGDRLYWVTREGLMASDGGRCVSITDEDLYPLFPHSGVAAIAVNGLNAPDLSSTRESSTQLSYGSGRLFLDYIDSAAARRTLEYRIRPGEGVSGWYPHVYNPAVAVHYYDQGPNRYGWLCGTTDATARLFLLTEAASDAGNSISYVAETAYENLGDPRKRKRFGDYTVEADTDSSTITVTPKFDRGTVSLPAVTITGSGGTVQIPIKDIQSGRGLLAVNMALRFTGTVTTQRPKVYTWEPTWLDRPEVTALRGTDFEDLGSAGLKFAQSIRILADTLGATRSVDIQVDGQATTIQTVPGFVSGNDGPMWIAKSFNPPILGRTFRVLPTDSGSWQLFKVLIEWEPEPELETHYETQQTTHDIDEAYKVIRDCLITLRSFSDVTFTIKRAEDGTTLYTKVIPTTAGLRTPVYLPISDIKARGFIYMLDASVGFALYRRDTWLRVRGWGKVVKTLGTVMPAGWQTVSPFGDDHRREGATT